MKTKYLNKLILLILGIGIFIVFNLSSAEGISDNSKSFYALSAEDINGEVISMNTYKGKKVLVVNVASRCGYTPQYKGLQNLYDTYGDSLVVLGFPSNDFMWQEPGSNTEIKKFCKTNYGVTFPMFSKIHVKGRKQHPIYDWLSDSKLNGWNDDSPSWNFNKYLLDENGAIIELYGADVKPLDTRITRYFLFKNSNLIPDKN
jgi:glutathione peroxidase